jgi:two-component system, response regulator
MTEPRAILLVEDNLDDQELILHALRRNNVANPVVVTRDGEQALEYLFGAGSYAGRDPSVTPQVVLLDLGLPYMSGLDVLRAIRAHERTRLQPVIVLTASPADEDIVRSSSLGANACVRKPIGFGEFAAAIRALGLFWLVLNEPPPTSLTPG